MEPLEVLDFLLTLKVGDRVKDIEHPGSGSGVVVGHLENGLPLVLWGNFACGPVVARLGTRLLYANG